MDFFSPAQIAGYATFVLGVVAFAQRIDWRLKVLVACECVVYGVHFILLGNNPAAVCQTAPKSDPQSASKIDPLGVGVRAFRHLSGGGAHWLLCLSLQLSLRVSMISQ